MNPNDLVTITNSKTKAVKRVKRSELPDYGLPVDYQSQADIYAQGIQKGNGVSLDKVPEAFRGGVQQVLNESGYKPPDTKKKEDNYAALINFINNTEKHYQGAGGASFGGGPLARIQGGATDILGGLGLNDQAKLYNDEKSGFVASLKNLTGDTGVLTQQDAERLAKLLPGLGSTKGEAQGKFNDLRSQLSAKYGDKPSQTTVNPTKDNSLLNLLFGGAKNVVNDSVAGATANLTEPTRQASADQNLKTSQSLIAQSQKEKDPAKRRALYDQAQALLGNTSQQAQEVSKTFSPEVNDNPFIRSLIAATQVAGGAEAPALTTGAVKGGLNFLKSVPKAFSSAGSIEARKAAADGVTVNTKALLDAGNKYAKEINPAAQKAWETLKPAIKNTTSADDLLEKLTDWGNKAYTQSGDVRAIAEGQLKNHLYKTGRDILKTEAPDIAKHTGDIAKTIGRKKMLGTVGKIAGGAAVTGSTYALLSYLFGQKQNGQQY